MHDKHCDLQLRVQRAVGEKRLSSTHCFSIQARQYLMALKKFKRKKKNFKQRTQPMHNVQERYLFLKSNGYVKSIYSYFYRVAAFLKRSNDEVPHEILRCTHIEKISKRSHVILNLPFQNHESLDTISLSPVNTMITLRFGSSNGVLLWENFRVCWYATCMNKTKPTLVARNDRLSKIFIK